MKKNLKLPVIVLFALTALILMCGFTFKADKTDYYYDTAHKFEVAEYDVTYDIDKNCSIAVRENLTISYLGYESTGFIRDIPVDNGASVRDVMVKKDVNGVLSDVWYDVYYEGSDFLSVDIGDGTNKYRKQESYVLTYTYNISNSEVNNNTLPLDPIGHGWECTIYNATVTLILPDGFKSADCYYGVYGSTAKHEFENTDNSILKASFDKLDRNEGVTFYLNFEDGSIKTHSDFTPYYFVLVGLGLLALIILLKLFVFNKHGLTPVVNYEAPDRMDPLIMGKLIDNKVNSEDVTSLIYYWASKGYIKINLDDKDDPVLIRITQELPEPCNSYERLMYNCLFQSGDLVKTSQLKNKFYKVVEQVTSAVNRQAKGLYESKSIGLSILFAVFGGLLLGLTPMILAITGISSKLLMLAPLISIVPALVIYAFAESIMYNKLKYKKSMLFALSAGLGAICVVFGVFYVLLIPSSLINLWAKIFLYTVSCLICACSVILISRTKQYTEKLNDIIGFKNFIELAEKDQLEMMLEEDPQFYYRILPYAQVLGVTDKWEEKFESLTVEPPQWLTGDMFTTYLEFRIINSMLRSSMGRISSGMISRPSSSGSNIGGRGFGGGGGGFSGGGFGGGGGRGR